MQERLIELETRLAFQEETLEQLNRIIVRQQTTLDSLQREIDLLKKRLAELQPLPLADPKQEPPPPHY